MMPVLSTAHSPTPCNTAPPQAYFRVNYLIVMGATCITTFLMNPSSLMVLGILLGVWIYFMVVRQAPVVISGRTLSDREKLMGLSAISFITVFFLTSVGR